MSNRQSDATDDPAGLLYGSVAIGMAPDEVRRLAGEPERQVVGRQRVCWVYQANRVWVVFSARQGGQAVSRILLRAPPPGERRATRQPLPAERAATTGPEPTVDGPRPGGRKEDLKCEGFVFPSGSPLRQNPKRNGNVCSPWIAAGRSMMGITEMEKEENDA